MAGVVLGGAVRGEEGGGEVGEEGERGGGIG